MPSVPKFVLKRFSLQTLVLVVLLGSSIWCGIVFNNCWELATKKGVTGKNISGIESGSVVSPDGLRRVSPSWPITPGELSPTTGPGWYGVAVRDVATARILQILVNSGISRAGFRSNDDIIVIAYSSDESFPYDVLAFHRRFPESRFGFLHRPEIWIAMGAGVLLLIRFVSNIRSLRNNRESRNGERAADGMAGGPKNG